MEKYVEALVSMFENHKISRRQLVHTIVGALASTSATGRAIADGKGMSTFRGRTLNHVTISVSDVQRAKEFYMAMLGGQVMFETPKDHNVLVEGVTIGFQESFIGLFKLDKPGVHHYCVGVEKFEINDALEKLKRDFPESKPNIFRGAELYFRDPDGTLGQVSQIEYRGPLPGE